MSAGNGTACRLCGGTTSSLIAPSLSAVTPYFRCRVCGYIGLDPACFPSLEEEKKRYLLHKNSAQDSGYTAYLRQFIDTAILPYLVPGSRVLDFGSGPEPVLSTLLRDSGFDCDSYDPFFMPGDRWRGSSYDAIVLHEVAEHLHDPGKTLLGIIPYLKPGGLIAVRTRFPPAEDGAFLSWWYRMDSTHVGFFTPAGLEKLFAPRGFYTVRCVPPDILVLGST